MAAALCFGFRPNVNGSNLSARANIDSDKDLRVGKLLRTHYVECDNGYVTGAPFFGLLMTMKLNDKDDDFFESIDTDTDENLMEKMADTRSRYLYLVETFKDYTSLDALKSLIDARYSVLSSLETGAMGRMAYVANADPLFFLSILAMAHKRTLQFKPVITAHTRGCILRDIPYTRATLDPNTWQIIDDDLDF
jgi:hypothetical protein